MDWFEGLDQITQDPVGYDHPRVVQFRVQRSIDFAIRGRPSVARALRTVRRYPRPFEHVEFRASDDVRLHGWFAKGDSSLNFGVLLIPGMFATKDDYQFRKRAIRIQQAWDVPVLVLDMRAFGESTGIATAGWKEALDVDAAAEFLHVEAGIDRIAIIAESMGGAAALNALAADSGREKPLLTGGVTTWSAFVDSKDAVEYISHEPTPENPFHSTWRAFREMLEFRSRGGYGSFAAYLADAARVYRLSSVEELYRLANPKWKVQAMRSPALIVHAVDDPIVPVRHARRMQRYGHDQPNIHVEILNWGRHASFEAMDPYWYWETLTQFWNRVDGLELENPLGPVRLHF